MASNGSNDIFRMVIHRGIQLGTPALDAARVVLMYPRTLTPAARSILSPRGYGPFRRSAAYRSALTNRRLTRIDGWLRDHADDPKRADLEALVLDVYAVKKLGTIASSAAFRDDRAAVADALLATVIDPRIGPRDTHRSTLLRLMQLCGLIERVDAEALGAEGEIASFLARCIVVLPDEAFVPNSAPQGEAESAAPRSRVITDRKRVKRAKTPSVEPTVEDYDASIAALSRMLEEAIRTDAQRARRDGDDPTGLKREQLQALDASARHTISSISSKPAGLRIPDLLNAMQARRAEVGARAYAAARMSEIAGGSLAELDGEGTQLRQFALGGAAATLPGVIPPGLSRLPSVGDLKVVRETLLGYEALEIAHIENVLRGESKVRAHRLLRRDQVSEAEERERDTTTERDTQVAERFELEKESASTVSSDMQFQAGISVTASYGQMVSVTANAGFSASNAQSHSQREASKHARSVVERASSRVRELVRTSRTRITLTEAEETNTHTLAVPGTEQNLSGIYQWVEKVLQAQVYNYGRRLLLEFMVPEPALYYRRRRAAAPLTGVTRSPPRPFVTLAVPPSQSKEISPEDIHEANYRIYAGFYGATDVEPPPPLVKYFADAWKEDPVQGSWSALTGRRELQIEPGYAPHTFHASVVYVPLGLVVTTDEENMGGTITTGGAQPTKCVISVAGTRFRLPAGGGTVSGVVHSSASSDRIGIAVVVEFYSGYACEIEVMCRRTQELYDQWRINTYGAIVRAFEARRSEYEQQVRTAEAARGVVIAGRSSAENESIIRTELKRCVLTLLQNRQPPFVPEGLSEGTPPIIDLEQAPHAGAQIQFFEQACEWNEIVYVPYDYYWAAPTSRWAELADQSDPDHRMAEFLRAGWARVVVPVRPAFTSSMCFYLGSGVVWTGEHAPQLNDPLYISAVQEIQEADTHADGVPEGKPWRVRLPTSLVYLKPDGLLPPVPPLEPA